MNKFLKSLILLPVLLFSFSVFAATIDQPLNCCILRSDVDMGGGETYNEGDTVGGGDVTTCTLTSKTGTHNETKEWGLICILGSVGAVAHWIFVTLMVVVPLMIMLGAYNIMTAGLEPEKVKTGRNYIFWATVGLIVGLFSNAIPNFIASLITG